jgi:NADPH:quinone reductase-like Zn-dependent oxidoreductase
VDGDLPPLRSPLVPGHEVVGIVAAVGSQAQGRASVIDADTKAKLALMEAQARASSRASGGGGR